jgi:hypothetical protein
VKSRKRHYQAAARLEKLAACQIIQLIELLLSKALISSQGFLVL